MFQIDEHRNNEAKLMYSKDKDRLIITVKEIRGNCQVFSFILEVSL
jgi:hypothetical protein